MTETASIESINSHKIFQVFHDSGSKKIVIFCHGFRGTNVGPSMSFVGIARMLAKEGISSLRFDQYCSGNSEGDFINSSFKDWVETTKVIAEKYRSLGYEVGLFGQSMGGATVIDVASQISDIRAAVAWVPDPNVDEGERAQDEILEEGGQLIQGKYWLEARNEKIADKLSQAKTPMYIVQCSDDEYVSAMNHNAIEQNAQPNHEVVMMEGYTHSSWTNEQFDIVIKASVKFLIGKFRSS